MRAMILAAGAGKRMGDFTKKLPKPLLQVGDRYLIEYSLQALAKAGIKDVVINICYHREMIKQALGDGHHYGLNIVYSEEEVALETGGGIYQALPLLGDEPFIVMSADVITDFPLQTLPKNPKMAHLVLVDNPSYHPQGDFALKGKQVVLTGKTLTFANVAVFHPKFFAQCQAGFFRLGALLKEAIPQGNITGEHYKGLWFNVGTPAELMSANAALLV